MCKILSSGAIQVWRATTRYTQLFFIFTPRHYTSNLIVGHRQHCSTDTHTHTKAKLYLITSIWHPQFIIFLANFISYQSHPIRHGKDNTRLKLKLPSEYRDMPLQNTFYIQRASFTLHQTFFNEQLSLIDIKDYWGQAVHVSFCQCLLSFKLSSIHILSHALLIHLSITLFLFVCSLTLLEFILYPTQFVLVLFLSNSSSSFTNVLPSHLSFNVLICFLSLTPLIRSLFTAAVQTYSWASSSLRLSVLPFHYYQYLSCFL